MGGHRLTVFRILLVFLLLEYTIAYDRFRIRPFRIGSLMAGYRLLTIVGLLLVSVCFVHAQDAGMERAKELLLPFKQGLQTALREGMAQGPVQAIDACHIQAPGIAEGMAAGGIQVGRTSDRLRNPDNASPEWVSPILEQYLASTAEREPRIVQLEDDRVGYVEPISLQPLCLTCHGETLAPDVASKINELYPGDRATGYVAGDLRGVFWIDFPARQ